MKLNFILLLWESSHQDFGDRLFHDMNQANVGLFVLYQSNYLFIYLWHLADAFIKITYTTEQLRALLKELGFKTISYQAVDQCFNC